MREIKKLRQFMTIHPQLTPQEQHMILHYIEKIETNQIPFEQARIQMINELREASLASTLSISGRKLLSTLQRKEWLFGLLSQMPFSHH
ncbi:MULTISPECIES: hypothetical protein [Enterococcus]|uniref:Uncharacterized protein n=1 Tax=Enterococcus sulfureus ATCC 49903 TaxID=1140003 RepID=S0L5Y4_9ENTE|nr:hypothetical protein [Enterococcus sulfureus]EOT47738.1 hypothetical protein OMY_01112 [Enterococcus sulfureus ATCC 49903]EOT83841.1 hypothetical protein I573_01566 [Enterococcus sulfureus ATCC 49903]